MNILAQLMVSLVLLACAGARTQNPPVSQGILGTVSVVEGNRMPGPGRKNSERDAESEKISPREIFVYELTNLKQVQVKGPFYSNIQTKLVAKVTTGADGLFRVSLAPGRYSVFSKEPNGLFANRLDGEGNIYPVVVTENRLTLIDFMVDYNASY
ncbi:MAG: hypothetical protein JWQ14_335 [Adhaeribacter sp.]|nr:hypothetical protein [Adhaeribacter sp.]